MHKCSLCSRSTSQSASRSSAVTWSNTRLSITQVSALFLLRVFESWSASGPADQHLVSVLYGVKLQRLQVIVDLKLRPHHLQQEEHPIIRSCPASASEHINIQEAERPSCSMTRLRLSTSLPFETSLHHFCAVFCIKGLKRFEQLSKEKSVLQLQQRISFFCPHLFGIMQIL